MEPLENQVKTALIEKKVAQRMAYRADPEYKIVLQNVNDAIAKGLRESLNGKVDGSQIEVLVGQIRHNAAAISTNNTTFYQIMREEVENQYLNRKQVTEVYDYFEEEFTQARGSIPSKLFACRDNHYKICDLQQAIISDLVRVAKEEGVAFAVTDANEYIAIRTVFPTPAHYIDFYKLQIANCAEQVALIKELEGLQHNIPEEVRLFNEVLGQAFQSIGQAESNLELKRIKTKAKEIYR